MRFIITHGDRNVSKEQYQRHVVCKIATILSFPRESRETALKSFVWIPAFAGMTVLFYELAGYVSYFAVQSVMSLRFVPGVHPIRKFASAPLTAKPVLGRIP